MPELIKTLFSEATSMFPVVNDAPLDDNITLLHKHITNLLQYIDFNGNKYSLSGLIKSNAIYRSTYGHLFDHMDADL